MKSVGERLRELRDKRGMSQGDLGKALQVRQSTISEIETGGNLPSVPMLRRLAEFFGVQPGYFLDSQPEKANEEFSVAGH